MRRRRTYAVHCAEPGCRESSFYEFDSQREMNKSDVVGKPWRCVRHSMQNRVLSMDKLRVEWLSVASDERSYGRFFGNDGLLVHRGFYVDPKDFPVGTRVKVTCEVLLPCDAGMRREG